MYLQIIKYLGINLAKYVQGLYLTHYKMWIKKKENTENLSKYRDLPGSWFGRFSTVKTSILLKVIYGFNVISIQSPDRVL